MIEWMKLLVAVVAILIPVGVMFGKVAISLGVLQVELNALKLEIIRLREYKHGNANWVMEITESNHNQEEMLKDHEARLRYLERRRENG
jgi:hypothetical protein